MKYFLPFVLFFAINWCSAQVDNRKEVMIGQIETAVRMYEGQQVDSSIELINQTLFTAETSESDLVKADIYERVGRFYESKYVNAQAIKMYFKALFIYQKHLSEPEIKKKLAKTYLDIGGVYYNIQNNVKCEEYWQKSHKIYLELGHQQGLSDIINNLAEIDRSEKRYEQAIKRYEQAGQIKLKINDSVGYTVICVNLAEAYLLESNLEKCAEYLSIAKRYDEQLNSQGLIAIRLNVFGQYLHKKGDRKRAKTVFMQALEKAESLNDIELRLILYDKISQLFVEESQLDSSYAFKNKLHVLKDEVFESEREKMTSVHELEYLINEKNTTISNLEQETKEERAKQNVLIFVVCVIVIVSILFFFAFQQRIKKNKAIRERNELKIKNDQILKEKLQLELANKSNENLLQKEKIDSHQRELSSVTMHIISKNHVLGHVKEVLEESEDSVHKDLAKEINNNLELDEDWNQFKLHFENVHDNFFKTLTQKFPDLTNQEIRLCAYLRINLTSKEIAQILFIQPTAVNKRRNRLRKKLNADAETDLIHFLINI